MIYSFSSNSKIQPLTWHSQPQLLLAAQGRFLLSLSCFSFNYKFDLMLTFFLHLSYKLGGDKYERTRTNEIYTAYSFLLRHMKIQIRLFLITNVLFEIYSCQGSLSAIIAQTLHSKKVQHSHSIYSQSTNATLANISHIYTLGAIGASPLTVIGIAAVPRSFRELVLSSDHLRVSLSMNRRHGLVSLTVT